MRTIFCNLAMAAVLAIGTAAPAGAQAPQVDPLAQHQRLEARLAAAGDLTESQRAQMQVNLEACRALHLEPADLSPLFPGAPGGDLAPAAALRLQSAVIRAARGDLPLDPLLAKIGEGRRKGAGADALVAAGERVVDLMESAGAVLRAAAADGLEPAADGEQNRAQVRILTRAMWRGLTPEDGARLRESARTRLRDGPCTTADLAAAGELAVRIREQGGDPDEALRLAATALAKGYQADELAELGHLVTAGRLAGADFGALLDDLVGRVDAGLDARALNRELLPSGWMGPSDLPAAGGRQGGDRPGDGPGGGASGGGTSGSGAGDPQGRQRALSAPTDVGGRAGASPHGLAP